MRQPTPIDEAFAWWRDAVANPLRQIVHDNQPRCGFFKTRMTRGGIFVGARIYLEQDIGEDGELLDEPRMVCEVNGREADIVQQWTWLGAYPISEAEYRYLMARKDWAETYAPDEPPANPRQRLHPLSDPIPF